MNSLKLLLCLFLLLISSNVYALIVLGQYDYKFAEEILKEMFMRDAAGKLENEEIIRIFKQFGFDTNNFEVLTY